ncbi:unnamed protein product [Symbiodinium microadriaticum]|nr:unnamed protein product [Symbiodinium microadriaticum]
MPCTRAVELNAEVLGKTLQWCELKFLDINRLELEVSKLFEEMSFAPKANQEEDCEDDEEMFEADDAMPAAPAATEEPPAGSGHAAVELGDASMGEGDEVVNDGNDEVVEPPPPVHRHRSKASSAQLHAESTLSLPSTDDLGDAFEMPAMTDEQKAELAEVLAQIRQAEGATPVDEPEVVAAAGKGRGDAGDGAPLPNPDVDTQLIIEEPVECAVPMAKVTPAMQREMATAKRVKNRRGPGKPKAKVTKKNSRRWGRKKALLRSRSSLSEPADDPAKASGDDDMGASGKDDADPAEKLEPKAKAKAKARGAKKSKDKAPAEKPKTRAEKAETTAEKPKTKTEKAETTAEKPKTKAEKLKTTAEKPKPKGKAKPKAKAKSSKEAAPAEPEEKELLGSSVKQRRVDLGGRRWVYEILPGQTLGCAGCRYSFGGCASCRKECFRGKNAEAFAQTHEYVVGLSWINDDGANETEKAEGSKKRKRKGGASVCLLQPFFGFAVYDAMSTAWRKRRHEEAPGQPPVRCFALPCVLVLTVVLLAHTDGLQWDEVWQFVEVFAGKAVLSKCIQEAGYVTVAIVNNSASPATLTALAIMLILAVGGVFVVVPPAADTIESRFISINDLLQDLWLDAEMVAKRRLSEMKQASPASAASGHTPEDEDTAELPPSFKKEMTPEQRKELNQAASLRRMCEMKKNGRLNVPEWVHQEFMKGGTARQVLLKHFLACDGDKEMFVHRVEYQRRRSRKNTLTVKVGWYSKENMKKLLGWTPRDKYQKKIREYWVETGTEGTYQKEDEAALKEAWEAEGACGDEVTIGGPNPDEPLVAASAEEEDSESSEEEKPNRPKPRGGKPRGSGGKKSDLEEEAALEAVENVANVMSNILRTQAKLDQTFDKLGALGTDEAKQYQADIKNHRTAIMTLHDKMADLKSYFDGKGDMTPEKIKELKTMVQKVETDDAQPALLLIEIDNIQCIGGVIHEIGWSCGTSNCVENIASAQFLKTADRLAKTSHESRLGTAMEDFGLSAKIPLSYVDVTMKLPHPVLGVRDFVQSLSSEKQIDALFCGHDETDFADFWQRFKTLQPQHPVFDKHRKRLGRVIPIWGHADEGTSQKKRALMILQWQPILGYGTSRGGTGLNYVGASVTTRFLYSVMAGRLYNSTLSAKKKRLKLLVSAFARDVGSCFDCPVRVVHEGEIKDVFLCMLGLKGDWPALAKLGNLSRHHGRNTWVNMDGYGICHLCNGGRLGHEWHDVSYNNMRKMKEDVPPPWSRPSDLISLIPHSPSHEPDFYKVDVFHNLHKGLLADAAANAIDVRQFCKARGLELHMNALTKNALGLPRSTDFPAGPFV